MKPLRKLFKKEVQILDTNYSNLTAFMKRHNLTIGDLAKVTGKSYPPMLNKINTKETAHGKKALFDIVEAKQITDFILQKEQESLKSKFGNDWETEWNKRWGHIKNWFSYLFFDEVVANETRLASGQ